MKKIFLVLLLLIPISVNALNINVNGEESEGQFASKEVYNHELTGQIEDPTTTAKITANGGLQVNDVAVSMEGHTHVMADISDFDTSGMDDKYADKSVYSTIVTGEEPNTQKTALINTANGLELNYSPSSGYNTSFKLNNLGLSYETDGIGYFKALYDDELSYKSGGHSKIPANNRRFFQNPRKFYGDFRIAYKESC